MAVRLSSSYLRRSFQLRATLDSERYSGHEAFERASNIVYEWAKRKFSNIFRSMPYFKSSIDDRRDGNEIGFIYEPDKERFIFRGAHPDISVPGRIWITDTYIGRDNNDYIFAVRLSVTSLQSCQEEVPFSCPEFVRLIVDNVGVASIVKLTTDAYTLSTPEEVDSFLAFLEDPRRCMPVVLLTPCFNSNESIFGDYMMDATQMAQDLLGVAHVYQITQDANSYFSKQINRQWTAFNGAVRTYYPGVSFSETNYYQHPLLTRQNIQLRNADGNDESACMQEVEDYIKRYILGRQTLCEGSGIEFYLAAHQAYLCAQRNASIQSREVLIQSYEEQLSQLQKQGDENLSLADSYAKDCESLQEDMERQRQQIAQLKAQIIGLRFQLKEATGDEALQEVPEDGTYNEVEEWVAKYFPDRLVLLPRAVRSLKGAIYEDVPLVYKCLKLLATSYYEYRTGETDYDSFVQDCKSVDPGLDERAAITDVAAGMQGETYYVKYMGRAKKLERHLAKGSNKDRRYCLRIYFFWDEQNQAIVIGDLPHHLDTCAT